ncbi:MAG: LPS export ABC transporter periplasmic protein LptC [Novosphingobium sp.]|nr:LPS export ABC transporter periplasmic protein LptC [Novosphingobium sp.]
MTVQADQIRTRRRRFAFPGGTHDRLVRTLAVALPAGIGVLAAIMVFSPLSPRGEVSFLLDRNKVEVVEDRLRVARAMYRGSDDRGRPFSITAGSAVQRTAENPVVIMRELVARILLQQGPAVLSANSGAYDIDAQQMRIFGPVMFATADGYRMTANDVDIDVEDKRMVSRGRVSGEVPAGTFSADRIVSDLDARTVTLDGNARLRMTPGRMRMP